MAQRNGALLLALAAEARTADELADQRKFGAAGGRGAADEVEHHAVLQP